MNELPLPRELQEQVVMAANGLPIDAFLVPNPGNFSVGVWAEHPYTLWQVGWRPTLDEYFFSNSSQL
jgi:hypothetical protein